MNLVLDIGNTAVKFVLFKHDEVVWQSSNNKQDICGLQDAFQQGPIQQAIASAVAEPGEALENALLRMDCPLTWLTAETPIPIKNQYGTPQTLGSDRLAAVVGANYLYPENPVLVIDAGTCITYDLINGKGEYLGGNIAPGMNMRFLAMHQYTERLPLVTFEGTWPNLMGRNTNEALQGGVMCGIKAEVEEYINQLRTKMPDLRVILTGGDGLMLYKYINQKGVNVDELLVARGLNQIVEYNEN